MRRRLRFGIAGALFGIALMVSTSSAHTQANRAVS